MLGILMALVISQSQMIEYVEEISSQYSICAETVEALIEEESDWNADATSICGAEGLMQICPEWHQERMERLGVTDLYDPYSNILTGCDYLAELCERYGDIAEALMVYNMGNAGAEIYESGIISQYAEDILQRSMELEKEHGKKEEDNGRSESGTAWRCELRFRCYQDPFRPAIGSLSVDGIYGR